MENYNKTVRQKKELEKRLNLYAKESKVMVNNIELERAQIKAGLMDIQSKTNNLMDTVNKISTTLKEQQKVKYAELAKIRATIKHPQTGRTGNKKAIMADLEKHKQTLLKEIQANDAKLELLTGQKQQPEVNKATNVVNLIGKKKGFGAILSNIRRNKEGQLKLPTVSTKPNLDGARDVSELIKEFHKLPKIYPSKPKKKKPEITTVLLAQYEERRKKREMAMNYGTRTRIKRVQFYCNSLTDIYLPNLPSQNLAKPMFKAGQQKEISVQAFPVTNQSLVDVKRKALR